VGACLGTNRGEMSMFSKVNLYECVYICIYIRIFICIYAYMYVYAYMNSYINIYIHTHIFIHYRSSHKVALFSFGILFDILDQKEWLGHVPLHDKDPTGNTYIFINIYICIHVYVYVYKYMYIMKMNKYNKCHGSNKAFISIV
jgi:hypothetical protein